MNKQNNKTTLKNKNYDKMPCDVTQKNANFGWSLLPIVRTTSRAIRWSPLLRERSRGCPEFRVVATPHRSHNFASNSVIATPRQCGTPLRERLGCPAFLFTPLGAKPRNAQEGFFVARVRWTQTVTVAYYQNIGWE